MFNKALIELTIRGRTLDRGAPHQPTLREIVIQDSAVLHRAIVPDNDIADPPFVLIDELRLYDVISESLDQRFAVSRAPTQNLGAIVTNNVKAFTAGSGMTAHDGVFYRWIIGDIFCAHRRRPFSTAKIENAAQA